jgi:NAD(P)-dependent dehydrogenase (short-subunit alcohol dehydrogenase family)
MSGPAAPRVLVTGASGAFGVAASRALRDRGAHVVGLDLQAGEDVIAADVTDDASVAAGVAEATERLGGLDVLLNNAGVGGPVDSGMPPGADARRIVEVNLFGAWRVTAAALPALLESRGRVVFIGSRMSFLGLPLGAGYGVSKRAVTAYADALRAEYGTHLTVSCVHPSFVRTPIHDTTARAGLSVADMSREEPLDAVVAAIVRACTARRPPREAAPTRGGALQIAVARHLPGLADRVVARTLRRRVAAGTFDGAPIAAGLRDRHGA